MFDFLTSFKTPGEKSAVRRAKGGTLARGVGLGSGAVAARDVGSGAPVYASNVLMAVDTSCSVGQEQVDFVARKGVPAVAESLRRASVRNGIAYNLGVMTFATEVKMVLPLTDVRSLGDDLGMSHLEATGVTCMEKALWKAFDEIDRAKAVQDRQSGVARAGSLLVIVTDGRPTDDNGYEKALSDYVVREIARRNETRSCETFAIGMGGANDAVLAQLGPATEGKAGDGTRVTMPHAVRYLGDQDSLECWQTVYKLIGDASSSMTGKRAIAYTDDQSAWTRSVDTVRVDASKFRIVSQA